MVRTRAADSPGVAYGSGEYVAAGYSSGLVRIRMTSSTLNVVRWRAIARARQPGSPWQRYSIRRSSRGQTANARISAVGRTRGLRRVARVWGAGTTRRVGRRATTSEAGAKDDSARSVVPSVF